jgi:hypothetical protein
MYYFDKNIIITEIQRTLPKLINKSISWKQNYNYQRKSEVYFDI